MYWNTIGAFLEDLWEQMNVEIDYLRKQIPYKMMITMEMPSTLTTAIIFQIGREDKCALVFLNSRVFSRSN